MKNCIIAQSGGPTSVINASVMGVYDENKASKIYDNVYAGINGIEGILNGRILNLSEMSYSSLEGLKYTPSSALGSCRYKLKDFRKEDNEYKRLFDIMKELHIDTFFYVGGNDSMDTVSKLNQYAALHDLNIKVIGIPKTIDNDLMETDHTPGYGSAAKLIATVTLECFLDSCVYTNNGIFILETMGRDTGWLAASASLARINGKAAADFIYLPEVAFSKEKFLQEVSKRFTEQNRVFIVVSEGIKDEQGEFIATSSLAGKHDKFGHAQLGGVAYYLKQLIVESNITSRVKTQELGILQRSSMFCASETDIEEAHMVGREALKFALQGHTGCMIGIKRTQNMPYKSCAVPVDITKVANHIKYFPKEWITPDGNGVTEEAVQYIAPLIEGTPALHMEGGLPKYTMLTAN